MHHHRATFCKNRSKGYEEMVIFQFLQVGGRPPILDLWGVFRDHSVKYLKVFIIFQNLVGIYSVVFL